MRDMRDKVLRDGLSYRSRFSLPVAEADFVCALAKELNLSPDDAVVFLIRNFASSHRAFAKKVFSRAKADGRGPWK